MARDRILSDLDLRLAFLPLDCLLNRWSSGEVKRKWKLGGGWLLTIPLPTSTTMVLDQPVLFLSRIDKGDPSRILVGHHGIKRSWVTKDRWRAVNKRVGGYRLSRKLHITVPDF